MKKSLLILLTIFIIVGVKEEALSQGFDPIKGCVVDANGECSPNTILSAMPFLRIVPDARSGAMGDAGMALSPDPNAMHFNASRLAFVEKDASFSVTYTPWLRELNLDDIYLAYLSGFKKIDKLQTVGFGLRFFSLGDINFTDFDGNPSGSGKPRELEVSAAYARQLGSSFSAALTAKYIYSNLAADQSIGGVVITAANAFAADLSFTYKREITLSGYKGNLDFGLAFTNLGSKVSYTQNFIKDFLPANMGFGTALTLNFDDFNTMTFALDINKLMLPTPISPTLYDSETGTTTENPEYDCCPEDDIADYRQKSLFSGMFGSFGDAQGGFSEEIKELSYSFGVEYWYDKQFAVRTGYYYENAEKGDRKFFTVGLGLKYNVFGMDLSYLVPTNNRRNPLDNTLRFTLNFDMAAFSGGINEPDE